MDNNNNEWEEERTTAKEIKEDDLGASHSAASKVIF